MTDYLTTTEDEMDYEDYFPEERRMAFCDEYVLHEGHTYRALNGNTYSCPGFIQEDLDELERIANLPPCQHGMSAQLCSGPQHY
jgi:hypothetical protein